MLRFFITQGLLHVFFIFTVVNSENQIYTPKNILVTGGCGFIGSNFINQINQSRAFNLACLDKLDYCARVDHITAPCRIYIGDINNVNLVMKILIENQIDTVVHFAAQSHVDNSFGNSLQFTYDNVLGTHALIETCRTYGKIKRFIHNKNVNIKFFYHPFCNFTVSIFT